MSEFINNSKNSILAITSGVIPAILWLWFWLKEEGDDNRESIGLIILSFLFGALLVFIAIWLEKITINLVTNNIFQTIALATIEELLKFFGISIIILNTKVIDEPIDYPMYFIACALGFAAFENVLYLLDPIDTSGAIVGVLTGNLRFLGSTLLHSIASGMIGSALGLSFYLKKYRLMYLFIGIICAILLHSIFNFFIMKGSGENFLSVFGFLWVVVIINILIFEKLKRMGNDIPKISHII